MKPVVPVRAKWSPRRKNRSKRLLQPVNFLTLFRAGEGLRTLDVNLGKAKKSRFAPFPAVSFSAISTR